MRGTRPTNPRTRDFSRLLLALEVSGKSLHFNYQIRLCTRLLGRDCQQRFPGLAGSADQVCQAAHHTARGAAQQSIDADGCCGLLSSYRVGGVDVDGIGQVAHLDACMQGHDPLVDHLSGPAGHDGGTQEGSVLPVDQLDEAGGISLAVLSSVLLGTHPVQVQSPPMRSFSTRATRTPSCAAKAAADKPPDPAPIVVGHSPECRARAQSPDPIPTREKRLE
jgi:hypothetical protein